MNVETGIDQTAPVLVPGPDVVWADFKVEKDSFGSLVDKIVSGMTERILDGRLRVGAKMPSIRQLAKLLAISTFTVVEAYERLASTGLLSARRGSGYLVSRKEVVQPRQPVGLPTLEAMRPLVADLYFGVSELLPVGASWLPPEWYGESMVIDAVRHAMRMPANRMRGYGHPLGFPALRQHLASTLSANLFEVAADQIVMTHGSIHAFDIILRALTQPGDTVLVEDPGYANLPAMGPCISVDPGVDGVKPAARGARSAGPVSSRSAWHGEAVAEHRTWQGRRATKYLGFLMAAVMTAAWCSPGRTRHGSPPPRP